MKLVVDRLNLCHLQADVERALEELPVGMEAFYDRMASIVAQNPSAADRALALSILQCVATSLRVLTLADLSQALEEDISEMLDFRRTVVDICGGFVVIDKSGNVAMIHQTAREYLVDDDSRPFHIDRSAAHKHMFLSCMRCLMVPGLRGTISRGQELDFLNYAASFWPAHLSSAPSNCKEVTMTLHNFLTGRWILTWIQLLASRRRLHTLIHASKHLLRYSAKRKESVAQQDAREQELIDNWAIDLVKLVGKFGTNLRRKPESIYKLIPPFCPLNSSIYQQFGKAEAHNLAVSGLSQENWDDSLARISPGFGTMASSIAAAGARICILAPAGDVFIYDSSLFAEVAASPITHGERVYRMELNDSGTVLATYGHSTTRIWETRTGKCRLSVQNLEPQTKRLAMRLTQDDSILLVGSDDRRIRSLDLTELSPDWQLVAELYEQELEGQHFNSASHMALNSNGTLAAIADSDHPLSAWEVGGSDLIDYCRRGREQVAEAEVIETVWNPRSPELLGLYLEGVVFKWRPYDGESEEIDTGASRLTLSGDGALFATGDAHGTVKIYTTTDFCLLYQLGSQDSVLGLAFSPDMRRFYDIRGYYGNAWEPNALSRYAEQAFKGTETETDSLEGSAVSVSWAQRVDPITVLTGSPSGQLYCCGTEKGIVRLHNAQGDKLKDIHVSESSPSITHMVWSDHGRYIGFSDSDERVYIFSIRAVDNSMPLEDNVAEIPMADSAGGPILQLLFCSDEQLLIYTSSTICTLSMRTSAITHSRDWYQDDCRWIVHPQDSDLLLGIGTRHIHLLNHDLSMLQTYQYEYSLPEDPTIDYGVSLKQDRVDQVLVTPDKQNLLVQISLRSQKPRGRAFLYFSTSSLPSIGEAAADTTPERNSKAIMTLSVLAQSVSSQIALALSFLPQNRLVFLSTYFSICCVQLASESSPSSPSPFLTDPSITTPQSPTPANSTVRRGNTNRHDDNSEQEFPPLFSLPGDWISRDCLALCSIWDREKSLLCPRNGAVAVVRCAALA